jgi:arabinogalactan oligomer/maltooligosaccharide transport system permease protein
MSHSPPVRLKKKTRIFLSINLTRLLLIITCMVVLFPIIWMATASISKGSSLFSSTIIPKNITLKNYINLFEKTKFIKWIRNSAIVTLCGSLLALLETTTMAYAFSRFRFKGKKNGLMILILLQMLPATVTIVALYKLAVFIQLQNTFLGLILIYAGTTIPFNAWLMRGYFDSIPFEIEESAYLDGANHWQAFTKIAFPLCLPMIVVVFLFNMISFYNDYYLASIILSGNDRYTVALGMRFFTQPYAENWPMFAAASILACLPIVVIFYSLQRYLVQGLTKGALKG